MFFLLSSLFQVWRKIRSTPHVCATPKSGGTKSMLHDMYKLKDDSAFSSQR